MKGLCICILLGSTQPNLKVTDLKRVPLPICSLKEQEAIANVLTAFDDKIELLQAQNKTLEDHGSNHF